jgi:hypothetical protein
MPIRSFYLAVGIDPGAPLSQSALYLEPATYSIDGAVKLGQDAVADGSDETAMVPSNFGLD